VAGALDAGCTVWMRQNRAPRLVVNVYNRYLISSRDALISIALVQTADLGTFTADLGTLASGDWRWRLAAWRLARCFAVGCCWLPALVILVHVTAVDLR
jgi:hypothetical protein